MAEKIPYSEDECILALYVYLHRIRNITEKDPDVVHLSEFLTKYGTTRTPGSVKAKVENFKSVDPTYRGKGLSNGAANDGIVWDRYASRNFCGFSKTVREAAGRISGGKESDIFEECLSDLPSDIPESAKSYEIGFRSDADIFRTRVLKAYGSECCITGTDWPGLLQAAPIRPRKSFGKDVSEGMDPCNGLCLEVSYADAFRKGLFTLDEKLCVELSPQFEKKGPKEILESRFEPYIEKKIAPAAEMYRPSEKYLEYHRKNVFADTKEKFDAAEKA